MSGCPVETAVVFPRQLLAPSGSCPDRIDSRADPARYSVGDRGESPVTSTWAA